MVLGPKDRMSGLLDALDLPLDAALQDVGDAAKTSAAREECALHAPRRIPQLRPSARRVGRRLRARLCVKFVTSVRNRRAYFIGDVRVLGSLRLSFDQSERRQERHRRDEANNAAAHPRGYSEFFDPSDLIQVKYAGTAGNLWPA